MLKKIKRIPKFFQEVKEEVKKVSWSTRQELIGATGLVIIVAALLTLYIFAIDSGLAKLMELFLNS